MSMNTSEAMERMLHELGLAEAHANRLCGLLTLLRDEAGQPSALVAPHERHLLARALREAADWCETVGALQGDIRWCGPVALLHNASTQVWMVNDPDVCGQIAGLMQRMRTIVRTLRHRAMGRDVAVRLS
jgi:hypothetical protein